MSRIADAHASARRSRPLKAAPKRQRLVARVSAEQKELFERAAALHGQPLSQFVVSTLQRAAEEAIRRQDVITLSLRDSRHFAALVLDPPQPGDRLRAAMRRQVDEVTDTEP